MTEKLHIKPLVYLSTSEPAGVQFVTDDGRVKFEITPLKGWLGR